MFKNEDVITHGRRAAGRTGGAEVASPVPEQSRNSRRKQRNRARLIGAARAVMSRRGVEGATIAEITEEADLALGTFYNYFESKEAILEAVVSDSLEGIGNDLDALIADIDDAAMIISTALRHALSLARRDEIWASFMVRTERAAEKLSEHLGHRARRDIAMGIERGRFRVADLEATLIALGGVMLAGIRAQLSPSPKLDSDAGLAASVLQMLGIDADEAIEIARRPMPELASSALGSERRTPGSAEGA
jgi:AcrR family transcriptional regulator